MASQIIGKSSICYFEYSIILFDTPRRIFATCAFIEAVHHISQTCFKLNIICKLLTNYVLSTRIPKAETFMDIFSDTQNWFELRN